MVIPTLEKGNSDMKITEMTLEILSQKSNEILKTLPVAHYLKVDTIPVIFDNESETSYFNPYGFEIHIALKNIAEAIVGSEKEEITDFDLEKHIRCFLYHEISHAILTPKELMTMANDKSFELLNSNFANILEDERIETILKDYYLGVDFKQNLRNVVPLQHAKTFENFVFNAVRFRYSPIMKKEVNTNVNWFIQRCKKINALSYSGDLCNSMELLLKYLKSIWDKLVEMAKDKSKSDEEDSSSSGEDKDTRESAEDPSQSEEKSTTHSKDHSSKEENEEDTDSSKEEDTKDTAEDDDSSEEETDSDKSESSKEDTTDTEDSETEHIEDMEDITSAIEDDFEEESADSILSEEQLEKIMNAIILSLKENSERCGGYSMKLKDYESDEETKLELLKVIVRNVGTGNNQQQAQYGYCGKFNAKRFIKDHNDSYKWFEKKAYEDNQTRKKSSKKILNIWLDQSGSFRGNDESINKVLKELYEIETKRKDFEWRLIKLTCDCILVEDSDKRFSKSWSGNALPKSKIKKVYDKVNNSHSEFNVVLFDGHANSMDFYGERRNPTDSYSYESLKPFDNKNTIFITERANTSSIRLVCRNAKAIIEENCNYASTLAKNVIKALDLLF